MKDCENDDIYFFSRDMKWCEYMKNFNVIPTNTSQKSLVHRNGSPMHSQDNSDDNKEFFLALVEANCLRHRYKNCAHSGDS